MFRHKSSPPSGSANDNGSEEKKIESAPLLQEAPKDAGLGSLKELLEKNLKWSQIIYEQNRRINNKLVWAAVASWIRLLLILIPLVLAFWFLPPYVNRLLDQYNRLFDGGGKSQDTGATLDKVLNLLPLNPAQEQQFKAMLK